MKAATLVALDDALTAAKITWPERPSYLSGKVGRVVKYLRDIDDEEAAAVIDELTKGSS